MAKKYYTAHTNFVKDFFETVFNYYRMDIVVGNNNGIEVEDMFKGLYYLQEVIKSMEKAKACNEYDNLIKIDKEKLYTIELVKGYHMWRYNYKFIYDPETDKSGYRIERDTNAKKDTKNLKFRINISVEKIKINNIYIKMNCDNGNKLSELNEVLLALWVSISVCKYYLNKLQNITTAELMEYTFDQDDFEKRVIITYDEAINHVPFLFEDDGDSIDISKGIIIKKDDEYIDIPSSNISNVGTVKILASDEKTRESFTSFLAGLFSANGDEKIYNNDEMHFSTILDNNNQSQSRNKETIAIADLHDNIMQISKVLEKELKIDPIDYLRIRDCIREWLNLSHVEKEKRTLYDYSFLDRSEDLKMVLACLKEESDDTIFVIFEVYGKYELWAIKGSVTSTIIHNLSSGCDKYPRFLVGDYKSGLAFAFSEPIINLKAPADIMHNDALYLYMVACSLVYKRYINKVESKNNIIIDNPSFSILLKAFESHKIFRSKKEIDLLIEIMKHGKESEYCRSANPFYETPKNTLRVIMPDFTDYRLIENDGAFQYDNKKSASFFKLDSKFKIISIYGSITIPACPYIFTDQWKEDMVKILNWIKINYKGEEENESFIEQIERMCEERRKRNKRNNNRKNV